MQFVPHRHFAQNVVPETNNFTHNSLTIHTMVRLFLIVRFPR
jgi:hypothetical protein